MRMLQIAMINGDVTICDGLEKCLESEQVNVIIEEGVRTIADIPKETFLSDFILLDTQLIQTIPITQWQQQAEHSKIILVTTYAYEAEAIQLLGKSVHGVLTKAIDQHKWQAAIYHTSKEQTPAEHYFITQLIPRILQWEASNAFLGKSSTALEAEVIKLLDAGQSVWEIARILQVDIEEIKQYIAIIGKVRSA